MRPYFLFDANALYAVLSIDWCSQRQKRSMQLWKKQKKPQNQWPMKKAGILFLFKDRLQKIAKDPLMIGCWTLLFFFLFKFRAAHLFAVDPKYQSVNS